MIRGDVLTVKRVLIVAVLLLSCHVAFALPETKLTADDAAASDRFGRSVSISGDYAIVGAYQDDDAGDNSGAVYFYYRDGETWTQQAKLTGDDTDAGDAFGVSVFLSGDYAIIGASSDNEGGFSSGAAFIFVRDGVNWIQQAKLTADDAAAYDYFGCHVSLSGNYAVVGAYGDDDGGGYSGSAYIFVRDGVNWSQQAKLTADDAVASDRFGLHVSISGDYALIGASSDDDAGASSGSAYIFARDGVNWPQQAKLTAGDAAANDMFGSDVSISGDYAAIGAYGDSDDGELSGSAYIFLRNGVAWNQQAKLTASDAAAGDWFGRSIFLSGDYCIVGADEDGNFGNGAAYLFIRDGENWSQEEIFAASDGEAGDLFGCSVSLDHDNVFIGAYKDNDDGDESGSSYVYLLRATHSIPRSAYVMIGVPYTVNDGDPQTLFRDDLNDSDPGVPNWRLSQWDMLNQKYIRYQETDSPDVGGDQDPPDFAPGQGYWLYQDVVANCELDIEIDQLTGVVPQNDFYDVLINPPMIDPAQRGLTMVANPFNYTYDWSTTRFWDGVQSVSIATAVASGWVNGNAYTWDSDAQQYVPISYDDVDTDIASWSGFWVEQIDENREIYLRFTPEGYGAGLLAGGDDDNRGELDEDEWILSLNVISCDGENRDEYNRIGVRHNSEDGYDGLDAMEFTPMASDFVQLYFSHLDWPVLAENFTFDYRSTDFSSGSKTWYFTVRTWQLPGEELELTWPGIEAVDDAYELLLYTPDNTEIDLRTTDSYTFTSDNETDSRQDFMIVCRFAGNDVAETAAIPVDFGIHDLYPNPFNDQVRISYGLPEAGDVKLTVFNILGQQVARIVEGNLTSGLHHTQWHAKNMASGMYLVKLEAQGQSSIRKVQLLR